MYSGGLFFFFKQKTAYEMRISDWSSDVCSSDLLVAVDRRVEHRISRIADIDIGVADHARADAADVEAAQVGFAELEAVGQADLVAGRRRAAAKRVDIAALDRKSVVEGKSVSVR